MPLRVLVFLCLTPFCFAGPSGEAVHYVGAQACALCHKDIAATQTKNAMANTWQGTVAPSLPLHYNARITEGSAPPLAYEIRRLGNRFEYLIAMPDGAKVTLPVRVIMGGTRHGVSFLADIDQVAGIPLERPALIEARYVYSSAHNALVLSPDSISEKPASYVAALGSALSPAFEVKCLTCHGQPNTLGAGKERGVHCESCHGPGWTHLQAVGKGNPRQGIVNPKRLSPDQQLDVCAKCHIGFTYFADPLPNDVLVSNQVTALRNTECFIQSGKALTCTTCHNPHRDSTDDEQASVKACIGCHSPTTRRRAAICPVNASGNCLGCHMPQVEKGSFRMVDHWIRVHPEQGMKATGHDQNLRSQIQPLYEFLRIIVTDDPGKAEAATRRLAKGEPFFSVARDVSIDATAAIGGYIGGMSLGDMDPKLAAAASRLQYGETSAAIDMGNRWMILQRLARDFKWEAEQLHEQAAALKLHGDARGALEKEKLALIAYPHFLRGLIFMGVTLAENGDVQQANGILQFAARLYPNDATTQFNLGLTLGGLGRRTEEVQAYRRAIELEPDLVSVYENLGAALYSAGEKRGAIDIFRRGLQVDPLSPVLYYDLGLALEQQGDPSRAKRAMTLATKLDPAVVSHLQK